jgi:hypothetical protein
MLCRNDFVFIYRVTQKVQLRGVSLCLDSLAITAGFLECNMNPTDLFKKFNEIRVYEKVL